MFVDLVPKTLAVFAGCVALAGLMAAFLFLVEARTAGRELADSDAQRARADLGRQALVGPAEDVDPTTIGVDAAAQDILPGGEVPEYVARDVDEELRAAIAAAFEGSGRWLVVVIGPSKVGKSRALFEAVTRCAQSRRLEFVVPVDGDAMRTILTPSERPARSPLTALWLDDLEPFLNDGVTLGTLREWHAGGRGRIVAATYGGKGSERIAGSKVGGLMPIAAEVLQSAREIPLAATTPRELEALRSRVSAAQFASLERHGLAAYLVAAPALERKLLTSRHGPGEVASPEGVAIVRAAVDWSLCGRTDAIQEGTLRALWRVHMPADEVSTDAFASGLSWALRPVAGTIALLSSRNGYRAYDYIVRFLEQQPDMSAPRDESWATAIESAQDAQVVAVGLRCYVFGRYEDAVKALSHASRSSNDEVASAGSYNLGVVLHEQGDPAGARAAWERTIAAGHCDRAPKAALNLGLLLEQQGDPANARLRLQQAIDSDHPEYAPMAMVNLGILLTEQQDPAGARVAYQTYFSE